ncbi:MAG: hemerythrin domain-containing protein [Phaeodactylibacter sp.]|nr:hemerythrin domain-containing protein [Phaeodactylibacter sp.]MCB9049216.1 hemerythrin domain-containing protein [Lewinellaceae bacterium]
MNPSPRVSLITTPHKGIRNFLAQLSFQAGSIDYADREAVRELKQTFEEIALLLEEHAASENNFILPPLEARVPGSTIHDEADHEDLHQLQDKLLAQLSHILDADVTGQEARRLGYEFYQGVSRLHAGHLEHMLEEETGTQVLMWQHFTDEEMMQIHGQVIRSIAPPVMLSWMKYILPAQAPHERLQLLSGLQANAPEPFFQQVMEVAKEKLGTKAFGQLEKELKAVAAG